MISSSSPIEKYHFPWISFLFIGITLGIAILSIGCGRKGTLEPPAGSTYSYPGKYPSEE